MVETKKADEFGLHFVLEIFRFRLRNAVVQTARNISERRKLTFNLPLTVHAVRRPFLVEMRGVALEFCEASLIISLDMLRKILRSPFYISAKKRRPPYGCLLFFVCKYLF